MNTSPEDIPEGESFNTVIPNSLELLTSDMTMPHEGVPSGVPSSYDWFSGPRISWGNEPPGDWNAMIPWGQVYFAVGTNRAEKVNVELRGVEAWYLSKESGEWIQWYKGSDLDGGYFAEDFVDNESISTVITKLNNGGISIGMIGGYNFHFWPASGRISMDPSDIMGVWVAVEGRLVSNEENALEIIKSSNLMLSVGADYWQDLTAPWDNFRTNGDIAIGRFRFLDQNWRTFNMHTITGEILASNPPPFLQ